MIVVWLIAIITIGLGILVTGKKAYAMSGIDTKGYATPSWIAYLKPLCQIHSVPLPYMLNCIEEESSGNPCAIGAPGAIAPDGNPRELGIIQLYNPDDLQMLGITGNQMRAFCVPGKIQVKDRHGNLVWSHRQDVARALTDDEMRKQADLAVRKILQARSYALGYAMNAKLAWTGIDMWRLTKLVHGLPGLVKAVTGASWQDYRSKVIAGLVPLDSVTEGYRSEFPEIFDNAEKATAGMETANV